VGPAPDKEISKGEYQMSKISDLLGSTRLSRRTMLASGGALAAGAAIGASGTAIAAEPDIDTSFKDFTLPKMQADDSLIKVQQKGQLEICTSNDWPYSYIDNDTKEFTGIDADILRFATKMLKIGKINVNTVPFDGMIPGLLDGRFDLVGDSIHYTIARAKVVDFTFPTYYYSEWLAIKDDSLNNTKTIADLQGKNVGALLGTNYAEWIQKATGVVYKGYKTWIEMGQDLQNGRLDAAVHDQPIIAASIKDHPEWGLKLAEAYQPNQLKNPAGYSRYAIRQGDVQLRSGFDAALQWMEDQGEMNKILTKWGLTGYNN
jgi:polar amino acid transport system substrate-binding protein